MWECGIGAGIHHVAMFGGGNLDWGDFMWSFLRDTLLDEALRLKFPFSVPRGVGGHVNNTYSAGCIASYAPQLQCAIIMSKRPIGSDADIDGPIFCCVRCVYVSKIARLSRRGD